MNRIVTDAAPAAIGPYSQAYEAKGLVFTSGQIGMNPANGALKDDIVSQARQACENVRTVLEAAGSSTDHVIKTTCYLQDMADFAAFNAVYEGYFPGKPARSCVAVSALPRGALCEIEAIAVKH